MKKPNIKIEINGKSLKDATDDELAAAMSEIANEMSHENRSVSFIYSVNWLSGKKQAALLTGYHDGLTRKIAQAEKPYPDEHPWSIFPLLQMTLAQWSRDVDMTSAELLAPMIDAILSGIDADELLAKGGIDKFED